jgi:hypothetical protein
VLAVQEQQIKAAAVAAAEAQQTVALVAQA